ncbi:DUF4190 domain-containing protein [Metabacillus idriensis]|uniref:DUF4190 domain-containing protein n=1 Tax=Metabacillus idriensis TaxID=324768 RepID=UPI001748F33A|nr:DUF4190 domain-containing protein [Metabacillus idriensis]
MEVTNRNNRKAILSFTFGILSIFIPFIGFIFGILGIVYARKSVREIKNTNETGRGLVCAGMICGITGIVTQFLYILLAVIGIVSIGEIITN